MPESEIWASKPHLLIRDVIIALDGLILISYQDFSCIIRSSCVYNHDNRPVHSPSVCCKAAERTGYFRLLVCLGRRL